MIFWLDLETTGLEEQNLILEVALIVTEDNLSVRQEYQAVVKRSDVELQTMNDWCQNQHKNSGLLADVKGPNSRPIDQVAQELNTIMDEWYAANDRPLLAGSSIHFDRGFLKREFPYFESRLHYRLLDVSSFKEGLKRHHGFELPRNDKGITHRAMPDIKQSLGDYKLYLSKFTR